ncbi:uncharacterized protein PAN0_008c3404 [Moesziomyces antarcticus]|uniref:Uncharacterized protein n=2 Tax=Pseudozyma antarctica TaxID=84753 RepID=A0A081CEU1_PSEA2|nr:uncharacterized protein PAN0_008c3404 [Moesziomyces antarcticus]GAK65187.1 hypothetical protein PAN0_008c3404 [Moesziomyces antarcticus]SPO46190.1 uncharacterized protein PSANT_03876 [Moesziomyces antarcticus]
MHFLFLVATAYVLVAAVLCQPLLDAANNFDSRSGSRWTRQPSIAKRRVETPASAREMVSELFGRVGRRVPSAAATKPAVEATSWGSLAKEELAKARPRTELHVQAPEAAPASQPRIPEPFKFRGHETGYGGDVDNLLRTRLYQQPPLTHTSAQEIHQVAAEAAAAAHPRNPVLARLSSAKALVAAGTSLTISSILVWIIKGNIDRTNEANAQIAATQAQGQADMQQVASLGTSGGKIAKRAVVEKRGARVATAAFATAMTGLVLWRAVDSINDARSNPHQDDDDHDDAKKAKPKSKNGHEYDVPAVAFNVPKQAIIASRYALRERDLPSSPSTWL